MGQLHPPAFLEGHQEPRQQAAGLARPQHPGHRQNAPLGAVYAADFLPGLGVLPVSSAEGASCESGSPRSLPARARPGRSPRGWFMGPGGFMGRSSHGVSRLHGVPTISARPWGFPSPSSSPASSKGCMECRGAMGFRAFRERHGVSSWARPALSMRFRGFRLSMRFPSHARMGMRTKGAIAFWELTFANRPGR